MGEAQDDWDFFLCERDGSTASILVNLGLRALAPDAGRPWRLMVQLKMRDPSPNGLSNADERRTLDRIDDGLGKSVPAVCNALFVGRMIQSGHWKFTYYAPSAAQFEGTVDHTMREFPDYTYSCAADRDPQWTHYFRALLPTGREAQQVLNRRVLENLQRAGDDLTAPREVSHFIYFQTPFERDRFLESIRTEGFDPVESETTDDNVRERRYCVVLRREDFVDFPSIQKTVLYLFDRASGFDGEYDGWETQVIKSN